MGAALVLPLVVGWGLGVGGVGPPHLVVVEAWEGGCFPCDRRGFVKRVVGRLVGRGGGLNPPLGNGGGP